MYTRLAENKLGSGELLVASPAASGARVTVTVGHYRTPWGMGSVFISAGELARVELPSEVSSPAVWSNTQSGRGGDWRNSDAERSSWPTTDQTAVEYWVGELEAYFRGERLGWSEDEIPLEALHFGHFERAVYGALLRVPAGATVGYGVLAGMAGHPRAARTVGNVMARNPIPVILPCHRVIRADGSLGNYGNNPVWKERLLEHELAHARSQDVAPRGRESP